MENIETNENDIWKDEKPKEKELYTDLDNYFPENYIRSEEERLKLYKRLIEFTNYDNFDEIKKELQDRFGKLPRKLYIQSNFIN